jgi:hypothetical protein
LKRTFQRPPDACSNEGVGILWLFWKGTASKYYGMLVHPFHARMRSLWLHIHQNHPGSLNQRQPLSNRSGLGLCYALRSRIILQWQWTFRSSSGKLVPVAHRKSKNLIRRGGNLGSEKLVRKGSLTTEIERSAYYSKCRLRSSKDLSIGATDLRTGKAKATSIFRGLRRTI